MPEILPLRRKTLSNGSINTFRCFTQEAALYLLKKLFCTLRDVLKTGLLKSTNRQGRLNHNLMNP